MTILDAPIIPDLPIYQLSVDQYHEMIRGGVLGRDDRIELLNGWMVPKMSNNPPHSVATELTVEAFRAVVPPGYSIRSEKPITLSGSEPEPDVVIAEGTLRRYADRHPIASEIAMVVEVSDSTLGRDRETKKKIYADAGIPCYWIVDLTNRKVEVYTRPTGNAYDSCEEFTVQVPFSIRDGPVQLIDVAEILP